MAAHLVALAPAASPQLTPIRMLTSWRLQPGVLAAVATLGGGYDAGLRRRARAGLAWPRRCTGFFLAGVVAVAVVGLSFIRVYDDTLFWTRALQNLALVAPLLVLYLTPLYALTLRSTVASGVVAVVLVMTAFAYFWTRFRIDPTPRIDPYGVTLWLTVAEMIGDAALGVRLWFGSLVAAGHYLALDRSWAPDPHTDQIIGAGVIWIGGDLIGLPFLWIVFLYMLREDERRTAAVDAELDAAEQARAAQAVDGTDEGSSRPRLWWEDDPQIAQRFRRRL